MTDLAWILALAGLSLLSLGFMRLLGDTTTEEFRQ